MRVIRLQIINSLFQRCWKISDLRNSYQNFYIHNFELGASEKKYFDEILCSLLMFYFYSFSILQWILYKKGIYLTNFLTFSTSNYGTCRYEYWKSKGHLTKALVSQLYSNYIWTELPRRMFWMRLKFQFFIAQKRKCWSKLISNDYAECIYLNLI